MTNEQIQSLVQLNELKKQGVLSQEEFDKAKASILNGQGLASQPLSQGQRYVSEPGFKDQPKQDVKFWIKKLWFIYIPLWILALMAILDY